MTFLLRFALCALCFALTSCASYSVGPAIDKIPHWAGGEPSGLPPRPGTPEYEAYVAQRARDAATPKTPTPKAPTPKTTAD